MSINLKQFKTIIFDFGGVIFDINPDLTYNEFNKLIPTKVLNNIFKNNILKDFEKGLISFEELHSGVNKIAKTNISKNNFINAWNAMLLNYNKKRLEYLKKMKQTHKLIMLSNTNELHYDFFSKKLINEYNISLTELFHKVYLSHKMGMIKPDVNIYKYVLLEQKIIPNETLFIEDTKENVITANSIGIKTLTITRNNDFYTYFE